MKFKPKFDCMKPIILVVFSFIFSLGLSAQTYNPFYGSIVLNTSSSNILNDLTSFESFGTKELGTKALQITENWIATRYQKMGYTDVVLQPFTHNNKTSNNIIVTKTGTIYPNTYLIIDAHYDTINGPGTNDNGTGTILLMELARLLQNVDTEYSIKFIHFSGEEKGLIGSKYYVNNTVITQNIDIKLVFNIDEVGGVAGMTNTTVVCESDQRDPKSNNAASSAATAILAQCMQLYSNLNAEISYAYSSDYIPFEAVGEIITGLYERNVSPVNHTINDNLANMDPDYTFEVVKGALGAVLQFAVAYDGTLSGQGDSSFDSTIGISPNSTNTNLTITQKSPSETPLNFRLIDALGKDVINQSLTSEIEQIPVDSLSKGEYLAVFKNEDQRLIRKIILN